jgi:hypothetical protein
MTISNAFALTVSVAALAVSAPAHAEWVEVQSTNFRYFSDDRPEAVVERVTNLEKLDRIVRTVTGSKKAPSPLRVTAYEVPTMQDVQKTLPGSPGGVAAYYTTSNLGAHLVTFHRPLKVPAGGRLQRTYRIQDEVTQHEYLHHMMFQYFPANYPTFYPEGFAEYYGTIQFEPNDVIVVGHAPAGRLEAMSDWLDVRKMLTAKSYADVSNLGGLYAQGWLLTHMAAARPERGKQLQQYLSDVSKGVPYEEAAEKAFGDLNKFNSELRAYKDEVTALTIKLNGIDPGPVTVRKLSPVEEQLVETELMLRSTVKKSDLGGAARRVAAVVAQNPGDAYGLGTLALVEHLAGDSAAARSAAERAIAADADNVRGNMVMGLILAEEAGTNEARLDAARQHFLTAMAADKTDTWSRIAFYDSYRKSGALPPPEAQNELMNAFNLMPSNDRIRYKLALDFEQRGMVDDAIFIISPAAFGTFDGDEREKRKRQRQLVEAADKYTNIEITETPLEMLQRLEAKRDGRWDEATKTIRAASTAS